MALELLPSPLAVLASRSPLFGPSAEVAPATDALPVPLAPTLRLLRTTPAVPDWQLFTHVLSFLLESRSPSDLAHRAAASLGLLPQVAWTDLEGKAGDGQQTLAVALEREIHRAEGHGGPERRWLQVGLEPPHDAAAKGLVAALLEIVGKLHARELDAQRLADAAYRDPLTGLWNRRGFTTFFDQALAARNRTGTALALMVCDLDHFKGINDAFGHATGDLALTHVAGAIQRVIRPSDVAARLGGDELVVLLGCADADGAQRVAARLRAVLADDNPLAPHPLTLSIGIADQRTFADDRADELEPAANTPSVVVQRETLFAAADRALYMAKERGRDRACVDPGHRPASNERS